VYDQIRAVTQLQGSPSVEELCRYAGVSRSGFYRCLREKAPQEEELRIRNAIHEISLEHGGRYGRRRIVAELQYRGMQVNHKRVARLMKEDNLLVLRRRPWTTTTRSDHDYPVYLNLASRLEISGVNQLWVADLTYIRLRGAFVYLAVVLDVFSRRVVGWALGPNLNAELPLAALNMALTARQPLPGLVHHSDRGVQYACQAYRERLEQFGLIPSMSRPGNPYDNAFCESFMKTLKQEEIYCNQYGDLEDLRSHIEQFIEHYYNRIRLHSALAYASPEKYEQQHADQVSPMGAKLNYFVPRRKNSLSEEDAAKTE
jgi:putative transposase